MPKRIRIYLEGLNGYKFDLEGLSEGQHEVLDGHGAWHQHIRVSIRPLQQNTLLYNARL